MYVGSPGMVLLLCLVCAGLSCLLRVECGGRCKCGQLPGVDAVDETYAKALLPVALLVVMLRLFVPFVFVFMYDLIVVACPAFIARPWHVRVIWLSCCVFDSWVGIDAAGVVVAVRISVDGMSVAG